ncbi:hypothetical protein ACIQC7_27755 [Kitasatospora sp. NPDC088556]|uniref:hypothetical protein n=1 Tax=Kitasatospora sp. NPDC088556 TaxID=3364076 RepID=UPI0038270A0A
MTTVHDVEHIPTSPSGLAHLMWELEQTIKPGEPDPSIALWKRLHAQEGYDSAAPLWAAACAYYDHTVANDDTES